MSAHKIYSHKVHQTINNMGLTLHYQGKINDIGQIEALQQEVQDICETMQWTYQMKTMNFKLPPSIMQHHGIEEYEDMVINGISFSPHPDSEYVQLYFSQQGILVNPLSLIYVDSNTNPLSIISCFTKTQFAGPEIHIAIVKLLKYLDEKYQLSLSVDDEGEYWEHLDKTRLYNNFERSGVLMDMVAHALEGMEDASVMAPAEILKQIENYLRKIGEKN